MNVDIDIEEDFAKCKDGYFVGCICEGCGMIAVANQDEQCIVRFGDFAPDKSRRGKWFLYDINNSSVGAEIQIKDGK